MESNIVCENGLTKLIKYYPNYEVTLPWYQDRQLVKQVDNRDQPYDIERLKRMYTYLDQHGDLFYIEYDHTLCGDVCLQDSGEIAIVISPRYQNKHIGRTVIYMIIDLAKQKGFSSVYARIYPFNIQSKTMFESLGFINTDNDKYVLELHGISGQTMV